MNFFKTFLASCLGTLITLIVLLVLMFGILIGISGEEEITVKDNSVLQLNLDAQITEQQIENPFEGLPIGNTVPNIGLLQLKQTISNAKSDPKIKGIFLNVTYPMTGFSTIEQEKPNNETMIKPILLYGVISKKNRGLYPRFE